MGGVPMWRAMEIKGSTEGTEKDPKFSLQKWFLDCDIPSLDELVCKQQAAENPLDTDFGMHGWIHKHQASQSPLLNVKDACLFPALLKHITEQQGIRHGSYALASELLFELASDFFDNFPNDTIARSYAGHSQIVNAIFSDKGANNFMKKKGGLHCGIRKAFVPCYDKEDANNNQMPS
jgi:hypothetical protein